MALILASASPRRQELLRNANIEFVVQSVDIPEIARPNEAPKQFAERLAREKALAVFWRRSSARASAEFILAADTIVVVDGLILGKPTDSTDAARILRLLSGRTHTVTTGVCLLGPGTGDAQSHPGFEEVRSETTLVTMDTLSEADIESYIATGEPMDKAGAYAIQGRASRWIPRIEGDYCNVVGLPIALVCRMLTEHKVA